VRFDFCERNLNNINSKFQ